MYIKNLLIIAGTGTNSGKTTMACRIIDQFKDLNINAIKISPHQHETTSGLIVIEDQEGYAIYEETSRELTKDTSRMLQAGAAKVFFAKVWGSGLLDVFKKLVENIPSGVPVICESPGLRNFVEPGLFIIMTSDSINKPKDISHLMMLPHVLFKLEDLKNTETLPLEFKNGSWHMTG